MRATNHLLQPRKSATLLTRNDWRHPARLFGVRKDRTKYVYGTTLTDSDIARNDLLRAVIYPDSDDVASPLGNGPDAVYDRVEHRYNRQGQLKETKDQNGSIHAFEFDKLGRQTHDRITTVGTGVDGAVRRVSTTFDVRSLVEKITSYDNATIGSGNVVNEIVREYNDLAMVVNELQEHGGAKDANTPYVGYNYDESATGGEFTKGLRLTSLRYPDGRLVHHTYGTSGSDADNLNRLDAIKDDSSGSPGATLAAYTYLGRDQVVVQDLPEPDIKLDLFGSTSGSYAGLDRFDRVVDQRWYDYGSSQDVDRFKYGYDRASNRVWRENSVSKSQSTPVYLDEYYTYDGLHRLKTFDRGELNATKTGITGTPSREEDWTLDPLGNWSGYVQKTSGTTDLDQERAVNEVNEITDITESTGTSWITPSYDRNGNMVVVPRPDDLANGYTCTFDAWNRLVKVEAGISTVATYAYDGLHRRTTKTIDSTVRHFYYTSSWQAIEERLDSSTSPERQFIWGPLYIDHLILRDRDTDANGTLDERLYALQDANWNVVAITDQNGTVEERYVYAVFGVPVVLEPDFDERSGGTVYDWGYGYTGRRFDEETGLCYYRARYYHAALGSFVGRDPLRGHAYTYLYAGNNPVNYVDPSGARHLPNSPTNQAPFVIDTWSGVTEAAAALSRGMFDTLGVPACWDAALMQFTHGGGIFQEPEGYVLAIAWSEGGVCDLPRPRAVHVRVVFTTWVPSRGWPNWCDSTAEAEIGVATWNIQNLPTPPPPSPECREAYRGKLLRGVPALGICSAVIWGWDCDVACACRGDWVTKPPGTCVTPNVGAVISGSMPGGTGLPEALTVSHQVTYTDECCRMRPCTAQILVAQST